MAHWLAPVISYLLGAIPFGLIIGLSRGIDIRKLGSGNIGASNVLRTLGTGPAVAVFFFDTVKGLAAVIIAHAFGLNPYLVVACGLMSIFGHTFSVFLGFKGGKGVATSLGVIIGLNPVIAGIAFVIWSILVAVTRYISLASIVATIWVALAMVFWKSMGVPIPYQALACVAALAIILKHTSNMKRLINGTEAKIGQKVDLRDSVRGEEPE
ncbi:MAG: glycerol-3-phosphate 1-O-acyltransferase PlsY [Armatimonadota bacterium]|nr:glycerol-3-phosphate 1-O-acyltransferase PlsY [bacterium]